METNKKILKTLKELGSENKSKDFEYYVIDQLCKNLGFDYIEDSIWNKNYKEYKKVSLSGSDDFSNCKTTHKNDDIIICNPNGSQRSPDIMIIHNKHALRLECKTSKTGSSVWNSGLPKKNHVYIFNAYEKEDISYALGQDLISDKEIENLNVMSSIVHYLSDGVKFNSKWNYYPRAMFNLNENQCSCSERKQREINVENFIDKFKWDSSGEAKSIFIEKNINNLNTDNPALEDLLKKIKGS